MRTKRVGGNEMSDPELEKLVKEAINLHFHGLARRGGAKKGACKARPREACQRARRRRTALTAARKRDFSTMGACGGASARGEKKARTTEQARAAALAGVAKRKERIEAEAKVKAATFVENFRTNERAKAKEFRETWFTPKA